MWRSRPESTKPTIAAQRPVRAASLVRAAFVSGDEPRPQHEVLRRVAGDGQLGEGHEVAAGVLGPLVGRDDALQVPVEVADGGVELRQPGAQCSTTSG